MSNLEQNLQFFLPKNDLDSMLAMSELRLRILPLIFFSISFRYVAAISLTVDRTFSEFIAFFDLSPAPIFPSAEFLHRLTIEIGKRSAVLNNDLPAQPHHTTFFE